MIAVFDTYHIDKIEAYDAHKIHRLFSSNYEHFETYFPNTLVQNLTLDLSVAFANKKIEQFKNQEEFLFTIKKTITGNVVGLVYIKNVDWSIKQGEFAYCVDHQYQRKNIATNAIKALYNYAFSTLHLNTLIAIIHKSNTPSIKSVENNNFSWTSTLKNEFTPPNHPPLDMELYTLHNER